MGEPILKSLDFSKDFILYTYGVENNNEECPITFFSKIIHNYEERYNFIEKQVYTIMKALNKLKYFVSKRKVLVLTIHLDVINYILKGELGEGIFWWVTKIN